jgi:hypothetical protein
VIPTPRSSPSIAERTFIIIGGIISGILVVAILGVLIFTLRKRHSQK